MFDSNTQTLQRPRHFLDLPRATVWTFALAGSASLWLAHALDAAIARRATRREWADRPRARLGPSQSVQSDHLIPDSWKVR
jgi:hypothetical protein